MFKNKEQQIYLDDDSEDSVPSIKVVMLGDSGVGKTSLVKQWSIGIFEPAESPTICAFSSLHRVVINKNVRLSNINRSIFTNQNKKQNFEFKFSEKEKKHSKSSFFQSKNKQNNSDLEEIDVFLWDTAGQEQYAPLSPLFLRQTSAVILTLSIIDRCSFEDAAKWINLVKQFSDGDPPIILAINKTDMLHSIQSIVKPKKFNENETVTATNGRNLSESKENSNIRINSNENGNNQKVNNSNSNNGILKYENNEQLNNNNLNHLNENNEQFNNNNSNHLNENNEQFNNNYLNHLNENNEQFINNNSNHLNENNEQFNNNNSNNKISENENSINTNSEPISGSYISSNQNGMNISHCNEDLSSDSTCKKLILNFDRKSGSGSLSLLKQNSVKFCEKFTVDEIIESFPNKNLLVEDDLSGIFASIVPVSAESGFNVKALFQIAAEEGYDYSMRTMQQRNQSVINNLQPNGVNLNSGFNQSSSCC